MGKDSQNFVSYKQLKTLHVAEVQYEAECHNQCKQRITCQRIRETVRFVKMIASKLGQRNPLLQDMGVLVVGSLKENSRAFHIDEVDITLSLADEYAKSFTFNQKLQAAQINAQNNPDDVFWPYIGENSLFDASKFFEDFLTGVHSIISQIEVDEEWKDKGYTMDRPTTVFDPCTQCMSRELTTPECRRCCHEQNCKSHDDTYDCKCTVFTRPSLTRSKIGAVLHLQWTESDGTKFNIDCDVCCPTLLSTTPYDGSTIPAFNFLSVNKPVRWLEEIRKMEDMTAAAGMLDVKRSIRFKQINRETVMAQQVSAFYFREVNNKNNNILMHTGFTVSW